MSIPIDFPLLPFFEPQGIVLVGASRNPMKLGFGLARSLVQSGPRWHGEDTSHSLRVGLVLY
ncbi:MAG: hypothetical protein H6656_17495 [Ardenticatenaceae bacterium]|nr:hypothetical protein [Ardenticatenaceae bacterium]